MRQYCERRLTEILKVLFIAMLTTSIAACSGGSGDTLDDGPDGGDGSGVDGGGNDGGNDDGGNNSSEPPTARISPAGDLGSNETITVTFSESMDTDSLSLGGTLAASAKTEWAENASTNDTLLVKPATRWSTGNQTLVIDAESEDKLPLETLEAEFRVRVSIIDFQEADVVIGQQDFMSGDPNQGGAVGANTLNGPQGSVSFDAETGRLFVSDTGSARVLGFEGIPGANNANADMAIGQPDFTSTTPNTTASGMRSPYATTTATGQLIVTDTDSHRVLIFDEIPATGPASASVVLGQQTLAARETGCTATTMNFPSAHFVTPDGKLLVSDTENHRVLIWNEVPSENAQEPDLVLGQASFDSCVHNDEDQDGIMTPDWPPHANTLHGPTGIWSDGEKLIVADSSNHRVLIWNEFPTESFAEADHLLGQNSFRTMMPNDSNQDRETDGPSDSVFDYPNAVWSDGNQIFVSDRNNNRILVWNSYPERYFKGADAVIGQANFTNNAANDTNQDGEPDGAPSASTLKSPAGVQVIDGRLVITDSGNSRVLIYGSD